MAITIDPRFDFTTGIPQPSSGQTHVDGVLGLAAQGSPSAIHNRMAAYVFNEYERVMNQSGEAIGDYDFINTFTGLNISNVGDAIRRLKLEVDGILSTLAASLAAMVYLDLEFYGILTDWAVTNSTNGAIATDYYTPGLSQSWYEPTYEIINISGRVIKVLGGKVALPDFDVITPVNAGPDDGAYEFTVPDMVYNKNVTYEFGPTMALPADSTNMVYVQDNEFNIPFTNKTFNYQEINLGTIEPERGIGHETFTYTSEGGTDWPNPVSMVLVSGTESGGYLDTGSSYTAYYGHSILTDTDPIDTASGYNFAFNPLTGNAKTTGISGNIYAYYLAPDIKMHGIVVSKSSGFISLSELSIALTGEVTAADSDELIHYVIKTNYESKLVDLGVTSTNASFYAINRLSHNLESSIGMVSLEDSIVDVRRFKHKTKTLHTPPWMPNNYISKERYIETDIHGSEFKVVPLFIPLEISKKNNALPYAEVFDTKDVSFNQNDSLNDADTSRMLSKITSNTMGVQLQIVGIQCRTLYTTVGGTPIYPGEFTETNDLSNINGSNCTLTISANDIDGNILWEGSTQTPNNTYDWTVNALSTLLITNIDELVFTARIDQEPGPGGRLYIEDLVILTSTGVSKKLTTNTGYAALERYDYNQDINNNDQDIIFNSSGELLITKQIDLYKHNIENKATWNSSNYIIDTVVTLTVADTNLSAAPIYKQIKISTSNIYVLYLDANGTDLYLLRVSLSNPNDFTRTIITEWDISVGDAIVLNNTTVSGQTIDLDLNMPERPRVNVLVRNVDDLIFRTILYSDNISNTPITKDVYTFPVSATTEILGLFPYYEVDSRFNNPTLNLDRIDSYILYTTDDSNYIDVFRMPSYIYVSGVNYVAQESIISAQINITDWKLNSDNQSIVYSENLRNNNAGSDLDTTWIHTFSILNTDSVNNDSLITMSIEVDTTLSDLSATSLVHKWIQDLSAEIINITAAWQTNYIELRGEDLLANDITALIQPYTEEIEIVTEATYTYKYNSNSQIGCIIPRTDNWYDPSYESFNGDTIQDNVYTNTDKYQSLLTQVDELYTKPGLVKELDYLESTINGISREFIIDEITNNVVSVRSFPYPVVLGSSEGIARRLGQYYSGNKGEVFYLPSITKDKVQDLNIAIIGMNSFNSSSLEPYYPLVIPTFDVERSEYYTDVSNPRHLIFEIGSASDTGINAFLNNKIYTTNSYQQELVHTNLTHTQNIQLHSILSALQYETINSDNADLLLGDYYSIYENANYAMLGYGINSKWHKLGNTWEFGNRTSAPYVIDTNLFIPGDTNVVLTSSYAPLITINRYGDLLNIGSRILYNIDLYIHVEDSTDVTGTIDIELYNENDNSTVEYLAQPYATIYMANDIHILKLDTSIDLDINGIYELRVRTGFSVTLLRLNTEPEVSYFPGYNQHNIVLTDNDALMPNQFDIKLGSSSITEPLLKSITIPHEIFHGYNGSFEYSTFINEITNTPSIIANRLNNNLIIYDYSATEWLNEELDNTTTYESVNIYQNNNKKYLIAIDGTDLILMIHDGTLWSAPVIVMADIIEYSHIYDPIPGNLIISAHHNTDEITLISINTTTDVVTNNLVISGLAGIESVKVTISDNTGIYNKYPLISVLTKTGNNVYNNIFYSNNDYTIWTSTIGISVTDLTGITYGSLMINDFTYIGYTPHVIITWKAETATPGEVQTNMYVLVSDNIMEITPSNWIPVVGVIEPFIPFMGSVDSPALAFIGKPGYIITIDDKFSQPQYHLQEPGTNWGLLTHDVFEYIPSYTRYNDTIVAPIVNDTEATIVGLAGWYTCQMYNESYFLNNIHVEHFNVNVQCPIDLTTGTFRANTPLSVFFETNHLIKHLNNSTVTDLVKRDNEIYSMYSSQEISLQRHAYIVETAHNKIEWLERVIHNKFPDMHDAGLMYTKKNIEGTFTIPNNQIGLFVGDVTIDPAADITLEGNAELIQLDRPDNTKLQRDIQDLVMGAMDWEKTSSAPYDQPPQIIASSGVKRLKQDITYSVVDLPITITYSYSEDSGGSYDVLGVKNLVWTVDELFERDYWS